MAPRHRPRDFLPGRGLTPGLDVVYQDLVPAAVAGDIRALGVLVDAAAGQVATGSTVSDLIRAGGAQQERYQWVHGPSLNPFEPHEELDGVEFSSFDDEALANPDSFPDNEYYLPGDHQGCTCDFMPLWVSQEGEEDAA